MTEDSLTREAREIVAAYPDELFAGHPIEHAIISALRRARAEGYASGWDTAHEPARCGHARANYKDPRWPEAEGQEVCEACAMRSALEACVKAHETGRFEPAQAAYENARNALARLTDSALDAADNGDVL